MAVAMIKIGDLLDFSSPLAASMPPGSVLPQLTGTVHHRPSHYEPSEARRHRERKSSNPIPSRRIKVEDSEEERCPNVVVRNGVICMPYRSEGDESKRRGISDGSRGEMMEGHGCRLGGPEAGLKVMERKSTTEKGKMSSLIITYLQKFKTTNNSNS